MKYSIKEQIDILINFVGNHLRRHRVLLTVILSSILAAIAFQMVFWYVSNDVVPLEVSIGFYVTQLFLFLVTLFALIFNLFKLYERCKDITLAIGFHVYAAIFMIWSTVVVCLDYSLGYSPLIYIIVCALVAGVFVISPYYYLILQALSLIPIIIVSRINPDIFFGGAYLLENLIIFLIFCVVCVVISFRNSKVMLRNYIIEKKLTEMSYIDDLTGLLNERSYYEDTDTINKKLKDGEDYKFAVIVMDVNNLKATNDAYGHRYGCSLVVRCGHTLPTLLTTSKLYHIGGDEFVAIVLGEDLEKFEETIKRLDDATQYSIVNYEGVDLIFSVARGYYVRKDEKTYKEVFQHADNLMYENKEYLKDKYHLKKR